MNFELTHFNRKKGVQRFRSTGTREQLYGNKTPPKFQNFGDGWARITMIAK